MKSQQPSTSKETASTTRTWLSPDPIEDHLLQVCNSLGDFVVGEDGFKVFWPTTNHGAFNSWALRAIADFLDRENKDWANQLERVLSVPDADGEPLGL